MLYCLWFGNKKIHDLDQLKKYFDFDAAEMYLLGGGLSRWLRQCGENKTAAQVENIDLNGDISKQLSEIFSVSLPENRSSSFSVALSKQVNAIPVKKVAVYFPSFLPLPSKAEGLGENTDFGSFKLTGNFKTGSFEISSGSFEINASSFNLAASFFVSSSGVSSFSLFTGSYSLFLGSYEISSYNSIFGSGFGAGSGMGFDFGSFSLGSFNLSEYEYEYNTSFSVSSLQPGSFIPGSFTNNDNVSAVKNGNGDKKQFRHVHITQLSPEEKIKLNIMLCPLNRFGYGINLV